MSVTGRGLVPQRRRLWFRNEQSSNSATINPPVSHHLVAFRPGRFVLAGSTRHEALPQAAQALTGRLHRLPVYPLSQGEIDGVEERFLSLVMDGQHDELLRRSGQTTRPEYIERIVAGGFPAVLKRAPGPARARWFDDYLRLTLERDVRDLARLEQGATLPRLLERLAGQTGQVLNVANAAAPLQIKERTADDYVRLLAAVFLIHRLPAWGTTLTSRSAARPKVHMIDSGVADRDLGPMRKLQTAAGSRFASGVILYLGSQAYRLEDGLLVLPVDALWSV